jgi:hypothetical protein
MGIVPDFEDAAKQTLMTWLDTYLAAVKRQEDLGFDFDSIGSWSTRSFFEQIPGDEFLPMIVLISPSTTDVPRKNGKGEYRAKWPLAVGVVVSEPENPRRLAGYYAAAIRTCLIQKKLAGIDTPLDWVGERYDDLRTTVMDRSLAASRIMFEMELYDVATEGDGPPAPGVANPGDVPEIQEQHINVHPKEG